MGYYEQLSVVIGPVIVSAILGPLLLAMMSKAKQKAESRNYEVASDKARFEAMDLLVTHMRTEVDRLRSEASTERHDAADGRHRIRDLEDLLTAQERIAVDTALWALTLTETLEKAGLPPPARPAKFAELFAQANRELDEE